MQYTSVRQTPAAGRLSRRSGLRIPAHYQTLNRIIGRGPSARIVAIHEEVDSLDFQIDPKSAERMRQLEHEYIDGRKDAVTVVELNLSLAIWSTSQNEATIGFVMSLQAAERHCSPVPLEYRMDCSLRLFG